MFCYEPIASQIKVWHCCKKNFISAPPNSLCQHNTKYFLQFVLKISETNRNEKLPVDIALNL